MFTPTLRTISITLLLLLLSFSSYPVFASTSQDLEKYGIKLYRGTYDRSVDPTLRKVLFAYESGEIEGSSEGFRQIADPESLPSLGLNLNDIPDVGELTYASLRQHGVYSSTGKTASTLGNLLGQYESAYQTQQNRKRIDAESVRNNQIADQLRSGGLSNIEQSDIDRVASGVPIQQVISEKNASQSPNNKLPTETFEQWQAKIGTTNSPPTPTNSVDISVDGNLTIARGRAGVKTVTANISAWEGKSAIFTVQGLPTGASGKFSPLSCDRFCSTILTIITSPATPINHYEVGMTATRATVSDGAGFTLTITQQTKPNAPSNLRATVLSSSQIQLNWIDTADNETAVRIERTIGRDAMDNPNPPLIHSKLAQDQTSYTDTGLSLNTQYCYRVSVANDDDYSNPSGVVCATTQPGIPDVALPSPNIPQQNVSQQTALPPSSSINPSPTPTPSPASTTVEPQKQQTNEVQAPVSTASPKNVAQPLYTPPTPTLSQPPSLTLPTQQKENVASSPIPNVSTGSNSGMGITGLAYGEAGTVVQLVSGAIQTVGTIVSHPVDFVKGIVQPVVDIPKNSYSLAKDFYRDPSGTVNDIKDGFNMWVGDYNIWTGEKFKEVYSQPSIYEQGKAITRVLGFDRLAGNLIVGESIGLGAKKLGIPVNVAGKGKVAGDTTGVVETVSVSASRETGLLGKVFGGIGEKIGQIFFKNGEETANVVSSVSKITLKIVAKGYPKIGKYIELQAKLAADIADTKRLEVLNEVSLNIIEGGKIKGRGFDNYSRLTNEIGSAGDKMNWGHIVEKNREDLFGSQKVNNTANIIPQPVEINQALNDYYKKPDKFTNGKSVRKWIEDQKFDTLEERFNFEFEFGLEQLEKMLKKYGY